MKEMDIRITELCDLLHFSRPTMYRFIENYEAGRYRGIDRGVLSLFRYIDETPNIGKKNVISFIVNNIMVQNDDDDESKFIRLAKKYEDSQYASQEKTDVIMRIMNSSEYDDIIGCIFRYESVISSDEITVEDIEKIGKLVLFRDDVNNNAKLTKTQIKKVEKIIRGE